MKCGEYKMTKPVYIVAVTKPHKIVIHMSSTDMMTGNEIEGYDTYLDRTCGRFRFKTAKSARAFTEAGNKECANAYEYLGAI